MYLLIGAAYQVSDEAHGSPVCFNFFLNHLLFCFSAKTYLRSVKYMQKYKKHLLQTYKFVTIVAFQLMSSSKFSNINRNDYDSLCLVI